MKSRLVSALLVASALFAPLTAAAQVQRSRALQADERQAVVSDYFPLAVGNQWSYVGAASEAFNRELTVRVSDSREVNGLVYYQLEGFAAEPALVRLTGAGRLVALDEESGLERLWLDFAAPAGGGWTPQGRGECFGAARVAERNVRARTPAGPFGNGVRIEYSGGPCADAGLTEEVYAPNVGMLTRTELTIAGPIRLELINAVVDGRTIEARGLGFSLKIDSSVYVPQPERIAPGETPTLLATMTLENTSEQPLVLRFASGQRFDIEIRNADGKTVYVWSADKLFPAVTGELDLSPGVETWQAQIPLRGFDGQSLPPGAYEIEAWLTNSGGGRFGASVGFEIPVIVF